MSESKHTPGEWKWYGDELLSDKHFILSCGKNGRPSKADGDLIKAAPDMQETLQAVRDYVVTMKGMGHEYQVMIDAAIAKATDAA
jgi:hypothetical protein